MKKGFTLIELLVVIVIIGILVAIALPNFIKIKDKAKEAEVKQNLHAIQLAIERYAVDSNAGFYPNFIMGGDWTDSYVVWQEWADANELDGPGHPKYAVNGTWFAAQSDMGDTLVMESYMPTYPENPFKKFKAGSLLPVLEHVGFSFDGYPYLLRYVGGADSKAMVEIFGPTRMHPVGQGFQSIAGDCWVHHIFNNPPYDTAGDPEKDDDVDWNQPSGNSVLVGNFSYYPRPNLREIPWVVAQMGSDVAGYTFAGYGSVRTPGQDVYNRNGNYKGKYRTEPCMPFGCGNQIISDSDDVPCICPPSFAEANPTQNNGGSDTLPDGVVITLDSGVDKKSAAVNIGATEGV